MLSVVTLLCMYMWKSLLLFSFLSACYARSCQSHNICKSVCNRLLEEVGILSPKPLSHTQKNISF